MADQFLTVIIRNPEGIVFEGEVESVSSINVKGPFDILQEHENFISMIKEKVILTHKGGRDEQISLQSGVIKVLNDKVYIFLGMENFSPQQTPTTAV